MNHFADHTRLDNRLIGPRCDVGVTRHQRLERLGVREHQSVLDHSGVVVCEGSQSLAFRHEPEAAAHRRDVVDRVVIRGL